MSKINLEKEPDTSITGTTDNGVVEILVTENRTFVIKDDQGIVFSHQA